MIDFNINTIPASLLAGKIKEYNRLYRLGNPEITDEEYDILLEKLREIDPDNDWFKGVEPVMINNSRKRKLPIPMKSLNKVHSIKELEQWAKSLGLPPNTEVVIMPKFDGVSLLVDEQKEIAYSRGGSENEGQDCTEHYTKSLSSGLQSPFRYTFGEFIFNKANWETYIKNQISPTTGKPYKSSRNTIAGFINSDTPSDLLGYACLYRYGMGEEDFDNFTRFSGALSGLNCYFKQNEMYDVTSFSNLTEGLLFEYFDKWNQIFQIDGIVIYINDLHLWKTIGRNQTTGNPMYAIAYKSPNFSELFETTVKGVNWKVSKAGALKPTVAIDTVNTGDCEMKNPTGYNAAWICDNHIAKGAKILVIRSGGVIPKIIKTLELPKNFDIEAMWDEVAVCPTCGAPTLWNSSHTELCCTNEECPGRKLAKIIHFFTTVGCDGVGEETFAKLFDAGHNTIHKILTLQPKEIMEIEGFGESIATIIIQNNKRILNGVELPVLMHASDYFTGIGVIKAEKILESLSQDELNNIYDLAPLVIDERKTLTITMSNFYKGLPLFYRFVIDNNLSIIMPEAKEVITDGICANMAVCFSGVRDKELEGFITANGGKIASGVSKNTTHLVVKDVAASSTKILKARELGINIVTLDDFRKLCNC